MEIITCGVQRSGNILLRSFITEMLGLSGNDYFAEAHFEELYQRILPLIRRFLAKRGLNSDRLSEGAYQFEKSRLVLMSRHRISDHDWIWVNISLKDLPSERIVSTHSMPDDLPNTAKRFCTVRNITDTIDSSLNLVNRAMQTYVDAGQTTLKELFFLRWSSLDTFEKMVKNISLYYKSLKKHESSFSIVHYEELQNTPIDAIQQIATQLGIEISDEKADALRKKLLNKNLSGEWKFHYRDKKRKYFKLQNFLSNSHLRILEKLGINDLIRELGYDTGPFYKKEDIAFSNTSISKVNIPIWFDRMKHWNNSDNHKKVTAGNVSVRYCGQKISREIAEELSVCIHNYMTGQRLDCTEKRVFLYGAARLGKYVKKKLPSSVNIAGYIENDNFSTLEHDPQTVVIICSIEHESNMEKKLILQSSRVTNLCMV